MELKFAVAGCIAKPVEDVFEAVVSLTACRNISQRAERRGDWKRGGEVTWDFHDFPGAFPVLVQEVVLNRKIVLQWEADKKTATWTTVTMEFNSLEDGRTLVRISEFGWPETDAGLTSCFGNYEGWTGMLCAMKAWLEHGINLRDGFYK